MIVVIRFFPSSLLLINTKTLSHRDERGEKERERERERERGGGGGGGGVRRRLRMINEQARVLKRAHAGTVVSTKSKKKACPCY